MKTSTLYTSNDNGRLGKVDIIERTNTRYERESHAGFYMFLVALVTVGAWAASVIISHM